MKTAREEWESKGRKGKGENKRQTNGAWADNMLANFCYRKINDTAADENSRGETFAAGKLRGGNKNRADEAISRGTAKDVEDEDAVEGNGGNYVQMHAGHHHQHQHQAKHRSALSSVTSPLICITICTHHNNHHQPSRQHRITHPSHDRPSVCTAGSKFHNKGNRPGSFIPGKQADNSEDEQSSIHIHTSGLQENVGENGEGDDIQFDVLVAKQSNNTYEQL